MRSGRGVPGNLENEMKIAVTGKGGVGKTTLVSLLAYTFADQGRSVLAIDADPSPSLGSALGFPGELLCTLHPISGMRELIAERTGAKPGQYGSYFQLNPRVDDIPDRFSATHRGIRLLQLGSVEKPGGAGCFCAESTLLKALVTHVLLRRDEVVLLDFYAGVEHLGRATADSVDAMLVLAEPTLRSLATAAQIRDLARDIHLERLFLIGTKTADDSDREFIATRSPGLPLLGFLPLDPQVREADRLGRPAHDLSPRLVAETQAILAALARELEPGMRNREDNPVAAG
jgi:CO dehydrogenase maturation factor